MNVSVLGGGAFGTALAIALAGKATVTLWLRSGADEVAARRENAARLPGCPLPDTVAVTSDLAQAAQAQTVLLAVPMQQLRPFLNEGGQYLSRRTLIACCKGMELQSGLGPVAVIEECLPDARAAILTGPSFAADIARGLPTALTLACADAALGGDLQDLLSTDSLRLYRTTDVRGAELGGALKNVIAIACGAAMGAGLGESARAALMTRGYAEMQRLAAHLGADPGTLSGLSGFGDLTLTCTSEQSRNYRAGLALGRGARPDPNATTEGAATAEAVHGLAGKAGLDLPITAAVAAVLAGRLDVQAAMKRLLSRPLKEE